MAFQPCKIDRHAWRELHPNRVPLGARLHSGHLLAIDNQALGEEEPHRQFSVVSGGSHGDRDAAVSPRTAGVERNPDLQRLLDSERIRPGVEAGAVRAEDGHRDHGRMLFLSRGHGRSHGGWALVGWIGWTCGRPGR